MWSLTLLAERYDFSFCGTEGVGWGEEVAGSKFVEVPEEVLILVATGAAAFI